LYPDVGTVDHPRIATHPTVFGTTYVAFKGLRNWTGTETHVWLVKCVSGQACTAPVKVDKVPLGATGHCCDEQRGNKLAIDVSSNGRVDVIWGDKRNSLNDVNTPNDGDYYYNYSLDGGATFQAADVRLTHESYMNIVGDSTQTNGDYITVASTGEYAFAGYDGQKFDFLGSNMIARIHVQ
jgi:hypothetical protein